MLLVSSAFLYGFFMVGVDARFHGIHSSNTHTHTSPSYSHSLTHTNTHTHSLKKCVPGTILMTKDDDNSCHILRGNTHDMKINAVLPRVSRISSPSLFLSLSLSLSFKHALSLSPSPSLSHTISLSHYISLSLSHTHTHTISLFISSLSFFLYLSLSHKMYFPTSSLCLSFTISLPFSSLLLSHALFLFIFLSVHLSHWISLSFLSFCKARYGKERRASWNIIASLDLWRE